MKGDLDILRKHVAKINRGEGDDYDPIFAAFKETYCIDIVNSVSEKREYVRQAEEQGAQAWYTVDQIAKLFNMSKNDVHLMIACIKKSGFELRSYVTLTISESKEITRYHIGDFDAGQRLLWAIKTVREASKLDNPFEIIQKFTNL